MRVTKEVADVLNGTFAYAAKECYEYITPELLLYMIAGCRTFREAFENCGGEIEQLKDNLKGYLNDNIEQIEEVIQPLMTEGFETVMFQAQETAENSGKGVIELTHLVNGFFSLEESYAVYYMEVQGVCKIELLQELTMIYEELASEAKARVQKKREDRKTRIESGVFDEIPEASEKTESGERQERWKSYVTCLNENLEGVNPLIGREEELERTMQILCRKEKNNPLHLGEPGVGKTAIVYGLAKRLNEGAVPEPLKGAKIFALEMGSRTRFFPYFSLIEGFHHLIARKTFASDLRFPGASFGSRGRTHPR